MRDSLGYELCRREELAGKDDDLFAGWTRGSYDEMITKGALLNLSEHERFEAVFTGFPLTLCREAVTHNRKR